MYTGSYKNDVGSVAKFSLHHNDRILPHIHTEKGNPDHYFVNSNRVHGRRLEAWPTTPGLRAAGFWVRFTHRVAWRVYLRIDLYATCYLHEYYSSKLIKSIDNKI